VDVHVYKGSQWLEAWCHSTLLALSMHYQVLKFC